MALWLMHTYAAGELGIWNEKDEKCKYAFLLGNIAPDWVNFVPDGRSLYRRKSHFRHQETAEFLLDDYIKNFYKPQTDKISIAFYKGYGFHLILDDVWGREVYIKYFGKNKTVPKSYYEECEKWDNIVAQWAWGDESREFLKHTTKYLSGLDVKEDLVDKKPLEDMIKAAQSFHYGGTDEKPGIIQEEDIKRVVSESVETYRKYFE